MMRLTTTRESRIAVTLGLAALTLAPLSAFAQGGPPGDPLGPDVFVAIRKNNNADLKALLAKGAQVENRNWLGLSPLMYAAICGNEEATRILLDSKADIESPSHFGTALTFAEQGGNSRVVKLLLDRGAKIDTGRSDGITPLMLAAGHNHLDVMRWMIEKKADVNGADVDGATPLIYAARSGHIPAATMLLEAGAKVDAADSHGMTALMYAAKNGRPRMIELLLKKGASPLVKDKSGATALALATRYAPEAETLRALKAGEKQSIARGNKQLNAVPVSYSPARRGTAAREAAEKAIALLEKTADTFSKNAGCISCHHAGLGLMTTGLAKERGFRYDQVIADSELTRMRKGDESHGEQMKGVVGHPEMYKYVPAVDMAEFVPGASFMFQAYVSHNIPSNPGLQGMATILAAQQEEDGRWGFELHREPMQWSEFTTTALTIRLLKAYFPKENAKELDERMARARKWLITTEPKTNEDRTFRLLALAWADAPRTEIDKAMADVKKLQRKDGGWAQYSDFRSDAYATGTTLYALHMAGMPAKDAMYRKGMDYLIRTQDPEGSWYVNKRGIAANTYFDAGFPHGESQYISFGATAWASMALMLGTEPAQRTASK